MDGLIIREAHEGDLDAITAIYAESVENGTATYELTPPARAEMGQRFAALKAEHYPYITAEQAGTLLGYAYAGPFRARPAYRFMVEDSIYLAPHARGQGVGRKLLAALIEACRANGYRQLTAVIGDGSPTSASVRLHEAMGFSHSGVLKASGYKHGRWLDTALMQLALNGGGNSPPDPDALVERLYQASLDKA